MISEHPLGLLMLGISVGFTIAAVCAAIQQVYKDRQSIKKGMENYKKSLYVLAEKMGKDRMENETR